MILIRYYSEHIIVKVTFSCTSFSKMQTGVFLKAFRKSNFLDSCVFSYFHGFGQEPLNPQESISEKTHLVTIQLKRSIFIFQDNFEINVFVSSVFKFSRNWEQCAFLTVLQQISEKQLLIGENFVGETFPHLAKISSLFPDENFYLCMKVIYKKNNFNYKTSRI